MADTSVIVDIKQQSIGKLSSGSPSYTPQVQVEVYTAAGALQYQIIGAGIIKFRTNEVMTGSAASQSITVTKPHRFLRYEGEVAVTSTGVADATSTNLILSRVVGNVTTNANLQNTMFSTNGAQPVDSVIFIGGVGWEQSATTYIVTCTAANTDTLYSYIYLEFLE